MQIAAGSRSLNASAAASALMTPIAATTTRPNRFFIATSTEGSLPTSTSACQQLGAPLARSVRAQSALAVTIAADGTLWVGGAWGTGFTSDAWVGQFTP